MKKLTPVLIVEAIEPCAAWWSERLGFARTIEVPHGDALGFVALSRGGVEVMYQTRASVADDIPALAGEAHRTVLYIEVADLDEVEGAIAAEDVVVPRRTTFYGATELGVREPGGSLVLFSMHS